jgi:hypothetical protein
MIGFWALQVGHHVAEMSTRMRAPRCCAASKLAVSKTLRPAALAADIAVQEATNAARVEMRNGRLCMAVSEIMQGDELCDLSGSIPDGRRAWRDPSEHLPTEYPAKPDEQDRRADIPRQDHRGSVHNVKQRQCCRRDRGDGQAAHQGTAVGRSGAA